MVYNKDEIENRVEERVNEVDERLSDIPSGRVMPDKEDMTIGTAKEFRLGFVFLDINNFTVYSSNNPDEDVLFMLNVAIPEFMDIVRDQDGIFEKNTGDGLLAYFGSGKNDVESCKDITRYISMVKYALANHINPILTEKDIEPITISVGATYGSAYISRIGVHSLNRRTAVGLSANIASKLENKTEENQYLIGHAVHNYAHVEGGEHKCSCFENLGRFESYVWGSDKVPYQYYNFRCAPKGTKFDNLSR